MTSRTVWIFERENAQLSTPDRPTKGAQPASILQRGAPGEAI
ncbi:MAG: hypothetical protein AAF865_17090 [Pseudomonadota bacterium]